MLAAAHLRASELKLSPRRENKASIGLKDFIGSARQRAVRLIRSRFLASDPFGISRRPLLALCDRQPLLCRTVAVSSQLFYGGRANLLAMRALTFALVLSLSLLGAERARAAELPLPGGAPVPPPNSYYPVSPPVNWGGVYIGLNGGYGLGQSNWSDSLGSTGNFAVNGGVFGGTLGINYAGLGDWVLLGLEGDFDWSGATGSVGCSVLGPDILGAGATCQTRINWLSTFRFRAGYTWSHFLFYATAGGAVGNYLISTTAFNHNPTAPLGWTAGAGVEYLFNDSVSVKLEYLFVNLLSVSCPSGTGCSSDQSELTLANINRTIPSGSVSFTENLIRAGVNYKFSW
jgi:outer membrane immunogenic protein